VRGGKRSSYNVQGQAGEREEPRKKIDKKGSYARDPASKPALSSKTVIRFCHFGVQQEENFRKNVENRILAGGGW